MDLPGAVVDEEEPKPESIKRKKSTSLAESRGLGLTSLPTGAIRRQSRSSDPKTSPKATKGPQYTVRLWEYGLTGWLEKHHFCAGLEVDLKVGLNSCADVVHSTGEEMQKDVHLPSTSLTALTQLQESLKSPSGLLLDIADCRDVHFTELFSSMLSELGRDVPGSIVQEAELLLNEHPYVTKEGAPSKDDAVGESMDIFLCCTAGSGLTRPVLALARLKMEGGIHFQIDEGCGEMRFAAVVLCDTNSEKGGRSLARALATTFMDEDFSGIARSAPRDQPETIREALKVYLAKLTIVPTVKLNKAAAAAGPMSPKGAKGNYTLENSLVSGIQRRMSLVTPQEAFDISKGDIGFERQHSNESENGEMPATTYHIEVDRFSNHEAGWQMEKCLRQGLEVDFALKEQVPHLPHVSCLGLEEIKRLAVPQNVAIDVEGAGVVDATMDCLRASGLPQEASEEVGKALKLRLEKGVDYLEDAKLGSELVNPNEGDEAALVLVISSNAIRESCPISGAFVRSKVGLPLRSDHPPARFIITLVGHKNGPTNLTEVGDSVAALSVDEELIAKMAKAVTKDEFVSAFESRLGDITLLPHAHMHAKRNAQDDMLLSPKGASPKTRRLSHVNTGNAPIQTISSASLGVIGTKSYVNKDGHIVTNVKSDIGFDHMHNHGPADDLRSNVAIGVRRTWRAVAWAQKYALPLVIGVFIAMVWMNIDEHSYHKVTHDPIVEGWEIFGHGVSMHFLVNDIFMCFFFGLAIKEVTEALLPGGSLSPIRRATNPLMATLGGVVGPVATYVIFTVIFYETGLFDGILCEVDTGGGEDHRRLAGNSTYNDTHATHEEAYRDCGLADFINGWGVPTATDISLAWMFAILVFGAGHPAINYLLLLAIADDALGMAIIAIAYPDPIHPVEPVWFTLVLAGTIVAALLRFVGVKYWSPYVFVAGPISWLGLIKAQVHPALALVCIVPFMPATHEHGKHDHDDELHAKSEVRLIGSFIPRAKSEILQRAAQEFLARRGAPLHAFEHHCKLLVDFGMFFFGVANAGVKVDGMGTLTGATTIALILGKTLGIVFFAMVAHALGFLLPVGLTVVDLFAMSSLGGVGLTVALFVSNEAFTDKGLQSQAKMGAVFSVASALLAFSIKAVGDKIFHPPQAEAEETEVELFSDEEVEAEEWLDVVAMNDIMQVLWTQRKYQARSTDLNIKRLARSVSKQNLTWQRSDAPLGFSRQSSGTVFRHWCHARESEIRVDDLLLILGDLGIKAHQELLEKALAGNIYATLDWPDFVSLLKDYRHLERQYHRKLFDEICRSEGSLSVEEVEVLLDRLGHPAALQAFDKCRKDRTSHMNFGAFEEFLRQLRLTEGFSQHDLRELHAFFEVEKTCAARLRKEPMCRCSLEKVQQVMMLRGFPTTEEEVQQMAEKRGFSSEHGVRFRQMLRLIRCLKDLERTQMLEIIQKYSQERRNAIQVVDLPLALGGLGYYPDEDAIQEHLLAIGERESEECLTPEELARFLQKYRQVSGFTREQYHNLAQSFSKADKTKRGQLNALELTEVLRRAGFHVSMQDVIQALYHFDLEGIGLLSLPEVLKLLRGLLAKEAETRRNAFLAACRGPSQKLPARDLAATIARVRGYQPDKTVLTSMLSILGLHSMGLSFTSFEHVCKLMRESDVKFMQNHSGYTPEQVAELKVHYQSYDPDDHGFIAGAKLPQLFLDAFPMYSTSTRQQQITKNYMEEVNQTYNGWTFEAFLGFVRMAEDEACHQDLLDEEQLVQDHALRAEECRGFREIFISKADHNCAVTDEDILDMFDFATAEFNQEQRMKFFQVLKGVDRHYYGTALRFPDFLRFMKRLTEKQTEENLGLVRGSLRLKRLEDEADAWARACRVVKRGMSRAGSLFFKTELEVQRIKSQSSQGSEKAVPAVP